MKKTLHECNSKRKPSLHIVDQVRYHVLYKAKLDALREKLPAHRKSISEMGTLIEAQTHSERRASMVRLGSLVEEQEENQRCGKEDESCRTHLLGLLEEQAVDGENKRDVHEILSGLRGKLVDKGHDEGRVQEQLSEIKKALMVHAATIGSDGVKGPEARQLEKFKF